MARNRIIGRETQKMQEYTQEQINQAESRGIEISTDVKEQLFEYANLIGEKEKVRACLGGILALNVAVKLLEKGIEVNNLFVIDSYPVSGKVEDQFIDAM